MNILTGNNLESGAVVWCDGTGWSLYVDDSVDVGDRADEIIAREESARRVVSAYALEASRDAKGVRPAHIKDRVRALGPTVRPDLTLKPRVPEAMDWVI